MADTWIHWKRCPLIPIIHYQPGTYQRPWNFQFHWLIFRLGTTNSVELAIQLILNDHHLQSKVRLPYFMVGIEIPLFPQSFRQQLSRKPKKAPPAYEA